MNRRNFLGKSAAGAAAALLAPTLSRGRAGAALLNRAPFFNRDSYRLFAGSDQAYSAHAIELVQRTTVIDMLAPLWISPSRMEKMLGNPENFTAADYAPFKQSGINVFHIAIGTGGPEGRLFINILGAIAQFERDIMLARQRDGIAAAKAAGRYKGRKPTARNQATEVKALAAEGLTKPEIARRLGIGERSVYRILAGR